MEKAKKKLTKYEIKTLISFCFINGFFLFVIYNIYLWTVYPLIDKVIDVNFKAYIICCLLNMILCFGFKEEIMEEGELYHDFFFYS